MAVKTFRIEKDVKREVKNLLDKHKWFWWMPPANAYGRSGISDFHALRGGIFMVIETKLAPNVPTAQQYGFIDSIETEGAFAFVVNQHNVKWFAVWLQAFDASIASQVAGQEIKPEDGAAMLDAINELTARK